LQRYCHGFGPPGFGGLGNRASPHRPPRRAIFARGGDDSPAGRRRLPGTRDERGKNPRLRKGAGPVSFLPRRSAKAFPSLPAGNERFVFARTARMVGPFRLFARAFPRGSKTGRASFFFGPP